MAPLPVITDVYRCAHNYSCGEATATNVLWVHATGTTPNQLGLDLIHSVLNATAGSSWQALLSSTATFVNWQVTKLDGISPTVAVAYSPGTHGTGTTPVAAANAAGIVTLETGLRGRSFRGRIFMPFLPQGLMDADGARWSTSWVTDATLWLNQFQTNLLATVSAGALNVVSQKLATAHTVVSIVPRRYIGSQRPRTEREEPLP